MGDANVFGFPTVPCTDNISRQHLGTALWGKRGCLLQQEAWQAVTMPVYHRSRLRKPLRQPGAVVSLRKAGCPLCPDAKQSLHLSHRLPHLPCASHGSLHVASAWRRPQAMPEELASPVRTLMGLTKRLADQANTGKFVVKA